MSKTLLLTMPPLITPWLKLSQTCSLESLVVLNEASSMDVSGEPFGMGPPSHPLARIAIRSTSLLRSSQIKDSIRNTFTQTSWEDINTDALLARSACYPSTMPMNPAGNCTANDETWVADTYHI
ncbi:hypothetical protein F5146DRAFT_1051586 [Armillaria mellea]|nr:hypothetical protein F5146DRAFT_1051586 [Armillaria mellea]